MVLQMQCYAGCEGEDYVLAMRVEQGGLTVLQAQCYADCKGEDYASAMWND